MMIHITIYLFGIGSGLLFILFYLKYKISNDMKVIQDNTNKVYTNLLINIKKGESKFGFRINNHVRIDTYLKDVGNVNIYFYTNKNNVVILQNESILYTSNSVDEKVINELLFLLKTKFSIEIADTVNFLGIIYSKKYFTETFNINIPLSINDKTKYEDSTEVHSSYNIDEILDKINIIGYDKLTVQEKEFLKKYSNLN